MKIPLKRITVTYDQPTSDGTTGYMTYWDEPDYDTIIEVNEGCIRFWFDHDAQTIDYYRGGRTSESAYEGIEFTTYMHEDYEHCTVEIEFLNGNKVKYKCPENFHEFASDFTDYVVSDYTRAPGTSVMSRAAKLLDDEMQYEI